MKTSSGYVSSSPHFDDVNIADIGTSAAPPPDAQIRRAPPIEPQAPAILTKGLITPAEAEKLFKMYVIIASSNLGFISSVL